MSSLEVQDPKIAKKSPSRHHRTTLSGYIFATEAHIDNRKKNLLSSNISPTCPYNIINVGLLVAEIVTAFWLPVRNVLSLSFSTTSISCSSPSSCGLSGAGRCHSHERAPGLTILRSMIGGCQTNVLEWCQIRFNGPKTGVKQLAQLAFPVPCQRDHTCSKGSTVKG